MSERAERAIVWGAVGLPSPVSGDPYGAPGDVAS